MRVIKNGISHDVQVGLVDSDGVFCLLTDSDETHYYRFSSEADCVTKLEKQIHAMEKLNDNLIAKNETQANTHAKTLKKLEAERRKTARLEKRIEKLLEELAKYER